MKNRYCLKYGKYALFLLTMVTMLCGCGSKEDSNPFSFLFSKEEMSAPNNSDIAGVVKVKATLPSYEKPAVVEQMAQPDKTLINPMFSLSTMSFPEVTVLDKNGYFDYELLTQKDFDTLDKITEPTNISVMVYRDNARTDWSHKFSCFIYQIDPDYIYLGTAGHCIVKNSDRTRATVTFFDRETLNVSLEDYQMGANFGSSNGDYAMYRMKTSEVPRDLLLQLKKVHYDKTAMKNVKPGDVLYSGNIYAKDPSKDFDRQLTVLDTNAESTKPYLRTYTWYGTSAFYLTDKPLTSGQSGSAIFDKFGNLVAICSGGARASGLPEIGIFAVADKIEDLYDKFQEEDLKKE